MKRRSGFVSNSSSSSFIVAVTEDGKGKTQVVLDVNLANYGTRISNKAELDAYTLDQYGYGDGGIDQILEDEDWFRPKYEAILEAIDDGKIVYAGSASYNETEDPVELLIGNGGLKSFANVEIIDED